MKLTTTKLALLVTIYSIYCVNSQGEKSSAERKLVNAKHNVTDEELRDWETIGDAVVETIPEELYKPPSVGDFSRNGLDESADADEDGRAFKGVKPPLKDVWKEFLHSLYVGRYGRGLKSRTPLSSVNAGNLAVLGMVVLGGTALFAPILFPEGSPYSRKQGRQARNMYDEYREGIQNFVTTGLVGISESIMGYVEKSVDDLPSFPRLDAQECMKRSICEAHNQPKKYGIVGLVLQVFFPPYTETDEPSRIVSKYQLAARYGRQETANCAAQYDGCMINFLDLFHSIVNLVM